MHNLNGFFYQYSYYFYIMNKKKSIYFYLNHNAIIRLNQNIKNSDKFPRFVQHRNT